MVHTKWRKRVLAVLIAKCPILVLVEYHGIFNAGLFCISQTDRQTDMSMSELVIAWGGGEFIRWGAFVREGHLKQTCQLRGRSLVRGRLLDHLRY